MAIDLAALTEPVSEDQVCGPDLEMEGDADYMRFSARIEGILPKSFSEFDRSSIEFEKEFATIDGLLEKSRDLRLLVFRAKLSILNRDLTGFLSALTAGERLLEQRWEAVHPQLLDGDPLLRVIAYQTLDDMPDTVMPLQQMPLFKTRRFGPVNYRSYLLAEEKIPPRKSSTEGGEDERKPSASDVRTAISETDLTELVQARDLMDGILKALQHIETLLADLSGQPLALRFESVRPLAEEMLQFLDHAVGSRDPQLALTKPAGSETITDEDGEVIVTAGPAGAIDSHTTALRALRAASSYFGTREPSSLVRPLIKQAEALLGKSFYDALLTLVPDYASQATVRFSRDLPLSITLDRLSSLPGMEEDPSHAWQQAADSEPEPEPESEPEPEQEPVHDEPAAEETAEGEPAETGLEATEEPAPAAAPLQPQPPKRSPAIFQARTRLEALALLDQVVGYLRVAEPSSPIPALLEHARSLGGRDFFGLLRDVLPAHALRVDE